MNDIIILIDTYDHTPDSVIIANESAEKIQARINKARRDEDCTWEDIVKAIGNNKRIPIEQITEIYF